MGRLTTAVILAALLGSPAIGAPAPDPEQVRAVKAALVGSIEDIPTGWGGDRMGYDPAAATDIPLFGSRDPEPSARAPPPPSSVMIYGGSPLPPPSPPRPPAPLPPPGPSAADQVGSLVVRAPLIRPAEQTVEKCVTGPAWWRVTNGPTVLWIMGTPDQLPMDTVWDDTCLRKRMEAARVLILPAIPVGSIEDSWVRADTPLRQAKVPLNQRLPAPLWGQLSRRIDSDLVRAQAQAEWARTSNVPGSYYPADPIGPVSSIAPEQWNQPGSTTRSTKQVLDDTPNLFAPILLVARRLSLNLNLVGQLGNPVADRAAEIGGKANMLIGRTKNSQAQLSTLATLTNPPEADQKVCLKKVLDELDAGHNGFGQADQINAWAQGDVENGLKRMNVLNTCAYGDLGVRFWSSIVAQYMELIDRAMAKGGVAVMIGEFDPLFLKGGVMERLQAKNYKITPPEALR